MEWHSSTDSRASDGPKRCGFFNLKNALLQTGLGRQSVYAVTYVWMLETLILLARLMVKVFGACDEGARLTETASARVLAT
jgi:hypothetical protein